MSETIKFKKLKNSDFFGVTISGLCAIHCSITPLLFAAKPLLQDTISHKNESGIWESLDYFFLVLSLAAVWYSSIYSKLNVIKWALWISWLIFSFGLMSEHYNTTYGIWMMYIGSICLIISHIINHRYCKKCQKEQC